MLRGPTVRVGGRRVLGSPARMRVTRYLKGHGPWTVRLDTAITIEPGGISGNEDGIEPQPGQRWKIYTTSRRQPFATSICAGSARVRRLASDAGPDPRKALALWRSFPVDASPRPIVPLGDGVVLDPATGFRTSAQKLAYLEGRFQLGTALPAGAGTACGRLRAIGRDQHAKVRPLDHHRRAPRDRGVPHRPRALPAAGVEVLVPRRGCPGLGPRVGRLHATAVAPVRPNRSRQLGSRTPPG